MNKKLALVAGLALTLAAQSANAAAIAVWNFNDATSTTGTASNTAVLLTVDRYSAVTTPTLTVSGALTNFAGSTVGADSGDVAGQALTVQGAAGGTGAVNQNLFTLTFAVDTTGFSSLAVSYATQKTGTGFATQTISYSTDGGLTFTNFGTAGTIPASFGRVNFDFASVPALANNSAAQIRITLDGATTNTGNNRIDNVVFGVPEPTSIAALAGLSGLVIRRRK